MKIKPAEHGGGPQHGAIIKTECDFRDEYHEVHIHEDCLDIPIKEEPHLQLISEENNGDSSSCSDTKPQTGTSTPDIQDQQVNVKEECYSDHQPEYESTAVKEESESWIKDEDEEEAEEVSTSTEPLSDFFPCPHCNASFTEVDFLEKHVKWVHHKQYLAKLKQCFSNRTLSLITKHTCTVCSSTFRSKGQLRIHVREVHPSAPPAVQCPECGEKLRTPDGLQDHMNAHAGDRPLVCKNCCRRFEERSHWRQHMKIHTGEKPHKCQVCGKAFKGPQHLKSHLTTHTGERPFPCTVCGSRFIRLSHLRNHQRTHTGERPYKCTECDKTFTQSGDLVKHKRIHSGEKPFECPDCHRCYISSGDLGKHRRSHTNLRPYSCQECGKTFRLSGHLKSHMLTHTGEKPYSCPNCFRRFSRSHHLSGHVARCR
ncbi:gastrula zinc finger protein XlCGF57.1-like [Brachionichthys hirsutus]|uniref:gastrula zinc finger protein XlCGF57.1-like n=1 Tax=Brachionichthys hirsutus TaxID=412623 RepID=UPI0036053359